MIGKHCTTVTTNQTKTTVTYHKTDVVMFDLNQIVLNTGGYKTLTTKRRMNQTSNLFELGYRVYQTKGKWLVDYNDKTIQLSNETLTLDRK